MKIFYLIIFLSSFSLIAQQGQIKWTSFEDAIKKHQQQPKEIFIDVYTDWCGWCKKMDQSTFADKEVADYINNNFYAVKLDAEMKREIFMNGDTLRFMKFGRSGAHELAVRLLGGKMSYPSYVILDEKLGIKKLIKGYKSKFQLFQSIEAKLN